MEKLRGEGGEGKGRKEGGGGGIIVVYLLDLSRLREGRMGKKKKKEEKRLSNESFYLSQFPFY